MLPFEKKNISSNISRFKIIIERTENHDVAGILYNDFYGFTLDFQGIRQMLSNLDDFFDYINFPQATHEKRSFHDALHNKEVSLPQGLKEVSPEEMRNKQATLLLHVQFRQNSTWQGTLEWISEKKMKRFRSELELIALIAEIVKK